jgi:Ran GTPase-activating protein (RanGAP) involved in mRNA processing and transport
MENIFVSRKKEEIPGSLSAILNENFLQQTLQKLDLSNNAIVKY